MKINRKTKPSTSAFEPPVKWKSDLKEITQKDLTQILLNLTRIYPGVTPYLKEKCLSHGNSAKSSGKLTPGQDISEKYMSINRKYQELKEGILAFNFASRQTFESSIVKKKVFINFKDNIRKLLELEAKKVEERVKKEIDSNDNNNREFENQEEKSKEEDLKKIQFLEEKVKNLEKSDFDLRKKIQNLTLELNSQEPKIITNVIEKVNPLAESIPQTENEQLELLRTENKTLSSKYAILTKQKTSFKTKFTNLNERFNNINQMIEDAQKQAQDFKEKYDEVIKLKEDSENENNLKLDILNSELKKFKIWIQKINKSREKFDLPSLDFNDENDIVNEIYNSKEKELQESLDEIERLKISLEHKENELNNAKVKNQNDDSIEEKSEQIEILLSKISNLESKSKEIEEERKLENLKITAKTKKIENLKTKVQNHTLQIENLKLSNEQLTKEKENYEKELKKLETQIEEIQLENEKESQEDESVIEILRENVKKLTEQNDKLKAKNSNLESQLEDLESKTKMMKIELEDKKSGENTPKKLLSTIDWQEKYNDLKDEYEFVKGNFDEMEKELDTKITKIDELEAKIRELEAILEKSEEDLAVKSVSEKSTTEINLQSVNQLLTKIKQIKEDNSIIKKNLENRIENLKIENTKCKEENRNLGLEIEKLTKDFKNLSEIRKKNEELREEIEKYRQKSEHLEEKDKTIAEKLKRLLTGHRGSPIIDSNSERLLERVSTQFDNLERQNEELEKTIRSHNMMEISGDREEFKEFVQKKGRKILEFLSEENNKDLLKLMKTEENQGEGGEEGQQRNLEILKKLQTALISCRTAIKSFRNIIDDFMSDLATVIANSYDEKNNFKEIEKIMNNLKERLRDIEAIMRIGRVETKLEMKEEEEILKEREDSSLLK